MSKKYLRVAALVIAAALIIPVYAAAGEKPKQVYAGVANDFIPYAYLDDNGELVGYEIELLKAVDELLPQYEFILDVQADQWIALASGRVELITHQWEANAKRVETYLFGEEMITTYDSYAAFKPGREDIRGLPDLVGKKVQVSEGGGAAYFVETYNVNNPDAKIDVVYSSGDTTVTLSKIDTGVIDAYLSSKRMIETTEKNYGVTLGKSDEPIYTVYTYFVFRKDDPAEQELSDAIDGALHQLRAEGRMSELSIKWLGGDYTIWGPEHVD
ncbi:MAG: transporter substrate-binding domain-containing protein [Oscillospiraceae bacterium]|jgi:L-cystine transport system substrate-binding protein|nr:transporter substrate-binding domain-containing protein [Oscillospiraceae bacterium]